MIICRCEMVLHRASGRRAHVGHRPARGLRPRLLALEERTLLSVLTVTNTNDSGMGSLRAEVAAAQSGDTIVFSPKVRGQTITLTSGPIVDTGIGLTIQGPGAGLVTVSGNNQSGIFDLQPTDPSQPPFAVSISGLTLANAAGPDSSPSQAISDTNASLTLDGDVIADNQSGGVSVVNAYNIYPPIYTININIANSAFLNNQSDLQGAAVSDVGGVLDVSDSQFEGNAAVPIQNSFAVGGALWMVGAFVTGTSSTIDGSLFIGNSSASGGGAIENWGGPLTINSSTFIDNQSFEGGAIENFPASAFFGQTPPLGPLQVNDSTFIDNRVAGLNGYFGGGEGGAINLLDINAPTSISGSTFVGNVAEGSAGGSGYGGEANGGAIASSYPANGRVPVTISGSTFMGNQAIGGTGDTFGGAARGGAIQLDFVNATITGDKFIDNSAVAGSGGSGSMYPFFGYLAQSAFGGAIELAASEASITGCAFVGNSAIGGNGGPGQMAGGGEGGAVDSQFTPLTLSDSTFTGNLAKGGKGGAAATGSSADGGGGGVGVGGAFANNDFLPYGSTVSLTDVTITGNQAIGGAGGAGDGPGSGGAGGVAYGGAVFNTGGLAVASGRFTGNQAIGGAGGQGGPTGAGGNGGDGDGGAILSYAFGATTGAALAVTTSTFIGNLAIGGGGGMGTTAGSDGQGLGGAIAILDGTATITKSKFAGNKASTSGDDIYGTYAS